LTIFSLLPIALPLQSSSPNITHYHLWPFTTYPLTITPTTTTPNPYLITSQVPHYQYLPSSLFDLSSHEAARGLLLDAGEDDVIDMRDRAKKNAKNLAGMLKAAFGSGGSSSSGRRRRRGGGGEGLVDLVNMMDEEAERMGGGSNSSSNSRFAHAMDFSQEHDTEKMLESQAMRAGADRTTTTTTTTTTTPTGKSPSPVPSSSLL